MRMYFRFLTSFQQYYIVFCRIYLMPGVCPFRVVPIDPISYCCLNFLSEHCILILLAVLIGAKLCTWVNYVSLKCLLIYITLNLLLTIFTIFLVWTCLSYNILKSSRVSFKNPTLQLNLVAHIKFPPTFENNCFKLMLCFN